MDNLKNSNGTYVKGGSVPLTELQLSSTIHTINRKQRRARLKADRKKKKLSNKCKIL